MRPYRLSAPSSQMVEYCRLSTVDCLPVQVTFARQFYTVRWRCHRRIVPDHLLPYSSKHQKKTGCKIPFDISATRLSRRDPVSFPPHPREWLSIIAHQYNIVLQNNRLSRPQKSMGKRVMDRIKAGEATSVIIVPLKSLTLRYTIIPCYPALTSVPAVPILSSA